MKLFCESHIPLPVASSPAKEVWIEAHNTLVELTAMMSSPAKEVWIEAQERIVKRLRK